MSRVVGALRVHGARRAAEPLGVPGVARTTIAGGGVRWALAAPATITTPDGQTARIAPGVPAVIWGDGGTALDVLHHAYATFVEPGGTSLWAARQQDLAGIAATQDLAVVAWVDLHHDLTPRLAGQLTCWATPDRDGNVPSVDVTLIAHLGAAGSLAGNVIGGPDGRLWVCRRDAGDLAAVDPATGAIQVILTGQVWSYAVGSYQAINQSFNAGAIAFAPDGSFYVANGSPADPTTGGQVAHYHADGTFDAVTFTAAGVGAQSITGLAMSRDGHYLYFGDSRGAYLYAYTLADGTLTRLWGDGQRKWPLYTQSPPFAERIPEVAAITVLSDGSLLVAGGDEDGVYRITFAGPGIAGPQKVTVWDQDAYFSNPDTGVTPQLHTVAGVAQDACGNLLVAYGQFGGALITGTTRGIFNGADQLTVMPPAGQTNTIRSIVQYGLAPASGENLRPITGMTLVGQTLYAVVRGCDLVRITPHVEAA